MELMAERIARNPPCWIAGGTAEHPFGTIKHWMGQGTFLTRHLNKVRGEFSLTALTYNIRRAINLVVPLPRRCEVCIP